MHDLIRRLLGWGVEKARTSNEKLSIKQQYVLKRPVGSSFLTDSHHAHVLEEVRAVVSRETESLLSRFEAGDVEKSRSGVVDIIANLSRSNNTIGSWLDLINSTRLKLSEIERLQSLHRQIDRKARESGFSLSLMPSNVQDIVRRSRIESRVLEDDLSAARIWLRAFETYSTVASAYVLAYDIEGATGVSFSKERTRELVNYALRSGSFWSVLEHPHINNLVCARKELEPILRRFRVPESDWGRHIGWRAENRKASHLRELIQRLTEEYGAPVREKQAPSRIISSASGLREGYKRLALDALPTGLSRDERRRLARLAASCVEAGVRTKAWLEGLSREPNVVAAIEAAHAEAFPKRGSKPVAQRQEPRRVSEERNIVEVSASPEVQESPEDFLSRLDSAERVSIEDVNVLKNHLLQGKFNGEDRRRALEHILLSGMARDGSDFRIMRENLASRHAPSRDHVSELRSIVDELVRRGHIVERDSGRTNPRRKEKVRLSAEMMIKYRS